MKVRWFICAITWFTFLLPSARHVEVLDTCVEACLRLVTPSAQVSESLRCANTYRRKSSDGYDLQWCSEVIHLAGFVSVHKQNDLETTQFSLAQATALVLCHLLLKKAKKTYKFNVLSLGYISFGLYHYHNRFKYTNLFFIPSYIFRWQWLFEIKPQFSNT